MEKNRKRVEYLDILKTIAIFLVCFCHFIYLKNDYICAFVMLVAWSAVPIFFIVNGFLLFKKEFDLDKHIKKIRSVFFAFIVWKVIYLIIESILYNLPYNKFSISDIISYLFFFKGLENINIGHLWFINTLLILYIIFPLLKACYDTEWGKKYLLILMISCFLIFGFLNDLDMLLKWLGLDLGIIYLYYFLPFKTNGIMLGFFILGGLVASDEFEEAIIKFDRLKIKIFAFILSLIGIIGMFLTKYHFDGTFKWNGNYLNDGYCRFTTTLVAVGIFFLFYKAELRLKSTKRIVTIISESTLATFYIHYFLGLALTVTYEIERSGVLFNSLKSLLFILISIIIALPMKKIPCLRKLV